MWICDRYKTPQLINRSNEYRYKILSATISKSNRNVQALKDAVGQNCFNGLLCSTELWGGPKVVFKLTSINYSLGRREDVRKAFVRKFLFEKFV